MATQTLTVHQLGSGSSGNATAVVGDEGGLLIDNGFSARRLLQRAAASELQPESISALLVTHCHGDHAGGAGVLARKLGIPIWATGETLQRLPKLLGKEQLNELPESGAVTIAGLGVETLPVSHDAPGTVIVRIDGRFAVATDLGTFDSAVCDFLDNLDGLLLECNHDPELLRTGSYPEWLQDRVLSSEGHLSNEQAAALLTSRGFRPPRQTLWLGHLSEENNRPRIARSAAKRALDGRPVEIVVARQDGPVAPVVLAG